jgi:hypothetical protein
LFTIVRNYFHACEELFWHDAPRNSFITRTVGVQALFDILRLLAPRILTAKDASVQYMKIQLQNAADLDFTLDRYNASGSGRTEVKRAIANAIGLT